LLLVCGGCKDEPQEDLTNEILTTFQKAEVEYSKANLSKSFTLFTKVWRLIETKSVKLDSVIKRNHLATLCYLGDISLKLENEEDSYTYYRRCELVAREYDQISYEIIAIKNHAELLSEYKYSKEICLDGIKKLSKIKIDTSYSDFLISNFALLYANAGMFDKAKSTVNIINSKVNSNNVLQDMHLFNLYKVLGEIHFLEKEFSKSLEHFESAIEIFNSDLSGKIQLSEIYTKVTEIYFTQKNYDKVESILQKACSLIRYDLRNNKKIQEYFIKLYEATGDLNKDLEPLFILREIEDSLNNERNKILKHTMLVSDFKLIKARTKYISALAISIIILLLLLYFYTILRFKHKKLEFETINKAWEVRNEEQKRFASILHDIVGANLSAINMQLSIFKKHLPEYNYDSVKESLTKTIHEVRNISHLMEPPALKKHGLIGAITEKAEDYSNNNFNVEVTNIIKDLKLKDYISQTLYSVVLELINNGIKYSQATKMSIHFSIIKKGNLLIKVSDNGVGFNVKKLEQNSKCLGLINIKSKLEDLGGSFDIESSNEGTSIELTIPT